MIRNTLLVAAALLLSGCFSYVPVPVGGELSQGTAIRASLTRPADYRLTNYTANDIVEVEGELVRAKTDTLIMSAFTLRAASGYEFLAEGETVSIPRARIGGVERKKLSVWQTALVAGGFVALVTLGGYALGVGGGGSDGGDGGGQTQ